MVACQCISCLQEFDIQKWSLLQEASIHADTLNPSSPFFCSREELISFKLSVEETRQFIGADSLAYLPLDRLHKLLGPEADTFCDACFSGAYPIPPQGKNTQGHVLPFEKENGAAGPSFAGEEGHSAGANGNLGYQDVKVVGPEEMEPAPAGRVV